MTGSKGRHELKHYINYGDVMQIRSRLPFVATPDKNSLDGNGYVVKSLYFDNYNDKVLKEKIDGVNELEKFRLRLYNDDTSFIRLEKKSKKNGLCFRTAVKEPLDIAFLFWAISAGIVIGAGLIPLSIIGSVFIGIILLVFVNKKSTDTPYIVVLNLENDKSEKECMSVINEKTKKNLIKAKTVTRNGIELTVEVRLLDMSTKFLNELLAIDGVNNACLVSYNGEYTA